MFGSRYGSQSAPPDAFVLATPDESAPGSSVGDTGARTQKSFQRRAAITLLVVCAFALGIVVGRTVPSKSSAGNPIAATNATNAARSTTVGQLTPSASGAGTPEQDASTGEMLIPGGGMYSNASDGQVTVSIRIMSTVDATLTMEGPMRLTGSNGATLPNSNGFLVAGWDYRPDNTPPPPLRTIAPHQHVAIVFTAGLDCGSEESRLAWARLSPTVVISFAGFSHPWARPVAELVTAAPDGFVKRLCGL